MRSLSHSSHQSHSRNMKKPCAILGPQVVDLWHRLKSKPSKSHASHHKRISILTCTQVCQLLLIYFKALNQLKAEATEKVEKKTR